MGFKVVSCQYYIYTLEHQEKGKKVRWCQTASAMGWWGPSFWPLDKKVMSITLVKDYNILRNTNPMSLHSNPSIHSIWLVANVDARPLFVLVKAEGIPRPGSGGLFWFVWYGTRVRYASPGVCVCVGQKIDAVRLFKSI